MIAGVYDLVIACGVESMSRVPMGSSTFGGDPLAPLARRYPEGLVGQGIGAELIAARWGLNRAQLDEYSARSHQLASEAAEQADVAIDLVRYAERERDISVVIPSETRDLHLA